MDQGRAVETDRLRRDMETTRASISETVNELRDKVSDAMSWRTYVERYPATTLAGAAALGLVVGRQVGMRLMPNGGRRAVAHSYSEGGEISHEARRVFPSGAERGSTGHGLMAALSSSWGRAGSRVEALVNRMIDDLAEAAERRLVPALVAGVQAFFTPAGAQEPETAHGPRARHATGEPPPESAVYGGGPTGRQAYSQPTRGAEPR